MGLKILHIIPSLNKGGAERIAIDICNQLQQRPDMEVLLVLLKPDNKYEFLTRNLSVKVIDAYFCPSLSGKPGVKLDEYIAVVNSFKPDVIHSHLFEAEILSRQVIFPGVVYVSHLHDNMKQFENAGIATLFSKELITNYYEKTIMLRKYAECNNHFIAISRHSYDYFRASLPKKLGKNIKLMPNGFDYNLFFNHAVPRLENETLKLINIGSLTDRKNQGFLIGVMKELVTNGIDVSLIILGDGPNKAALTEQIKQNGLEHIITLAGNVDNVEDYLSASHIYIHSAISEAMGLSILEAMAAGLPVVTTDGGGNKDLIIEGWNGYMVEHDTALFAEKILRLYSSKTLYQTMSAYCIEFAKPYDIKIYTENLISYYNELIDSKKAV